MSDRSTPGGARQPDRAGQHHPSGLPTCPDTRRHIGERTDDEVDGEAETDRGEDGAASDDGNLRAAVAAIASGFGPQYYTSHAAAGTPCDELWAKLGEAGFIGVNIPEAYGGGGGGLTELALVCEELGAQGPPLLLLVVSAAILDATSPLAWPPMPSATRKSCSSSINEK